MRIGSWESVLAVVLSVLAACQGGPTAEGERPPLAPAEGVVESATGGYHFTTDPSFFGVPVGNQITFAALRHADGSLGGRYRYEQEVEGERFLFSGPVTCFRIYDTPVLANWPDIPAMTANRAKWGGRIDDTNVPEMLGRFIWFQSIDNGEGANDPPDLSTISGFGDEAANEAFCASPNVPNPRFGPHPAIGNIQVRP